MQDIAGDLFATKGLEYLLVIGYLVLLVVCWGFVRPRRARADGEAGNGSQPLLDLPEDCHFHQGHVWARPEGDRLMRVGMDDFALKLLGQVHRLVLPEVGTRLEEGEHGWDVEVDGRVIPVLSPVDGVVVNRNEKLLHSPDPLARDPYGQGWVMEVRVRNVAAARRNLLSGRLAEAWREELVDRVRQLANGDGSEWAGDLPTETGLARKLDPEDWHRVARAFLLSDDGQTWTVPGADREGEAAEEVQTV